MARYYIAEIHHQGYAAANRFRIIETMQTIDGARDRLTGRSFKTLKEAGDFIIERTSNDNDSQSAAASRKA